MCVYIYMDGKGLVGYILDFFSNEIFGERIYIG